MFPFLYQIINWKTCLKFPDEPKISDEAKDLICHLLCDVEKRLGTRGVEEIKVWKCYYSVKVCSYYSARFQVKFMFLGVDNIIMR